MKRVELADQLARRVAEELLEAAVAAHDLPLAHEDDAGERVLEHRVLLAQQAMQHLVGALSLADVLEQPHVAACAGSPGSTARPLMRHQKPGAVLPAQPRLARVRAALVELAVDVARCGSYSSSVK